MFGRVACVLAVALGAAGAVDAHAALPSGVQLDVDGDGRDDELYAAEQAAGDAWPRDLDRGAQILAVARGRAAGEPVDAERFQITTKGRIFEHFLAGDVNGDGHADIALVRRTAPTAKLEVLVVAGRAGTGTIVAEPATSLVHRTVPEGDTLAIQRVSPAGDVDGDGRSDLLLQRDPRTLLAGAGLKIKVRTRDALMGEFAAAGDMDGDGVGDVQVLLEVQRYCGEQGCGGRVVLIRGSRRPRTIFVEGGERRGYRLRSPGGGVAGFVVDSDTGYTGAGAGDVDGDGLADVIVSGAAEAAEGTATVVYGKSDGAAVRLGRGGWPPSWRGLRGATPLFYVGDVAAPGDTNGDGRADIALYATRRRLHIAYGRRARAGRGERRPGWSVITPPGRTLTDWAAAGDVNGDGLGDLRITVRRGETGPGRRFIVFGARTSANVRLDALGQRGFEELAD